MSPSEPVLNIDMAAQAAYAAAVTFMNGNLYEAFAIPPELLRQRQPSDFIEMHRASLELSLHRRGIAAAIVERVLRLNKNPQPGALLRGLHRSDHKDLRYTHWAVSKGKFIREHGREAFEALPKICLIKRGRRRWVTHEAVRDRIWEVYLGQRRMAYIALQTAGGFYGDPRNVVRGVCWAEFAEIRGFDHGAGQQQTAAV